MEVEVAQLKEQVKALTARVNKVQGKLSVLANTGRSFLTLLFRRSRDPENSFQVWLLLRQMPLQGSCRHV